MNNCPIYGEAYNNTIDTAEPINETKKNTANEYTMFFFWFAIIIISTSIVFYKCTSNNTTKQTEIKSDMYFENQIQFLLLAESKEDFSEVSEYFDLYNIKRYWNMSNPSYNELNRRYKDFWKKTSHSTHNINLITKKENKVFDVNIDYEFLNEENNEWKEINYNIRFVFGQNNKIIEVYGLK